MSTNICIICAWRATCQKMFSVSGKDVRCADFVRDVSIKNKSPENDKTEEESRRGSD